MATYISGRGSDSSSSGHHEDSSMPSSSKSYKGVRKRKWGKWVSEIRLPNSRERIWLGSFDSPEKAARAFDAALYCLRGQGAKFNFQHSPPQIPITRPLTHSEIQEIATRYANEAPRNSGEEQMQQLPASQMGELNIDYVNSGSSSMWSNSHETQQIDWPLWNLLDNNVADFRLPSTEYNSFLPNQQPEQHSSFLPYQQVDQQHNPGYADYDHGSHIDDDDDEGYSQQNLSLWNF